MTASPNHCPLDRLIEQAQQHLQTAPADGCWRSVEELQALIPDELADACIEQLNETEYKDQPDPREYGRFYLANDAVKRMVSKEQIEKRTVSVGKEEFRLDLPSALAPSERPAATARSARASRTGAKAKGRHAAKADLASAPHNPPTAVDGIPGPAAAPAEPMPEMPDAEIPANVDVNSFQDPAVQLVEPDLPIHELAKLIPETGPQDYERIKESIRVNGQQVTSWTFQEKLLDGRTRQKVAKELGLKFAVREWQGAGSPAEFVIAVNLDRRHLTTSKRAMAAANFKPVLEEEARKRMLAGKAADPVANLPQGKARDQAAKIMKVSPRSVETASTVRKKGTPELVQAVEQDQISLAAAAELAELPPEEQKKILEQGKEAIKAQVKELRQRKARKRQS